MHLNVQARKLGLEFGAQGLVDLFTHPVIHPVQVHALKLRPDRRRLGSDSLHVRAAHLRFVCKALLEGLFQCLKVLRRKNEPVEQRSELVGQHLLSNRLLAWTTLVAHPGAAIVDVLAFLDLGGNAAAAESTRQEPSVGEIMCHRESGTGCSAMHHALDLVEELGRNNGLMDARIVFAAPPDNTHIDGILQHSGDGTSGIWLTGSGLDAELPSELRGSVDGDFLAGVRLEYSTDQGRDLRIGFDHLAMTGNGVSVAHRSHAREDSLLGFLGHALLNLFTEVIAEVLGKADFDRVNKLVVRPAVRANDDVLLNEVELYAQLIDLDHVGEVTVEAVRLLAHDDAL